MRSDKKNSAIAKKASAAPSSKKSSSTTKLVAGSAISKGGAPKMISPQEARTAAKVLASPTSAKSAKSLAASVLTQKSSPFPVKAYRVTGSSLTQKQSAAIVRKVAAKKNT